MVIKLEPQGWESYYNRGNVWRDKREFERATADYTQSISRYPHFGWAYRARGRAKLELGDKAGGEADLALADAIESGAPPPKAASPLARMQAGWKTMFGRK